MNDITNFKLQINTRSIYRQDHPEDVDSTLVHMIPRIHIYIYIYIYIYRILMSIIKYICKCQTIHA